MHLVHVPHDAVASVWPHVEGFITRACEHSRGTHTPETTFVRASQNQCQLWVIVDTDTKAFVAAGTTSMQLHDTGKQAFYIELLGGDNVKSWFDLKDQLEKWAKEEGCTDVFAYSRKGWAKHLPDYQITHYLMHKEL